MRLGVNIDHVATLRQARKDVYPNLVQAAKVAVEAGADSITIHLREDRRHIQDADVYAIRKELPQTHLNLEMAVDDEIATIAIEANVNTVCLVPEKRAELTTEGGLDVKGQLIKITKLCQKLKQHDIIVSLFIDPEQSQIAAAAQSGAQQIELHTGKFSEYSDKGRPEYSAEKAEQELTTLIAAAAYAQSLDLEVNAGHGLTYDNVARLAKYPDLFLELNIGHNIIAEAVFTGLAAAVKKMKAFL